MFAQTLTVYETIKFNIFKIFQMVGIVSHDVT